jgi:uncharacterized paraquat-inducible protein A
MGDPMEPSHCPACFGLLPPPKPGERTLKCPRCHHVLTPGDDRTQTGAHTPAAKRKSTPPARE